MKCPYCNNNLNIEDKFCPYCGKENQFAKEHQESMEHYEADYTATKEDVIAETRRFKTKTIRITILAVLVAIAAAMFILAMSADDLKYARREKQTAVMAPVHKAAIQKLMAEEDFLGVDAYIDANHIGYSDAFDEFYAVEQASRYYSYFYRDLLDLLARKIEDPTKSYYTPEKEVIADMGKSIANIDEVCKQDEWYVEKGCYTEDKVEYLNRIKERVELLARVYMNVPADVSVFGQSEARTIVMLEEYYNAEED